MTNELLSGRSLRLCEHIHMRCTAIQSYLSCLPSLPRQSCHIPSLSQIGKLRSELEVVNGNMKVMSEMLTELVPSQAEPSDLELLQVRNTGGVEGWHTQLNLAMTRWTEA